MNTQRLHTPQWFTDSTNSMFFGFTDMLKELKNLKGNNTTMIEIGSYMGESTMLFASSNIFNKIYTIDPHDGIEKFNERENITWGEVVDEYKLNTRYFDNIIHYEDYSYNVVDNFKDNSIDFIYIDANHSYESVKQDLSMYYPKVKDGGYIGGHDYSNEYEDSVCKAVKEVIGLPDITFEDTSWIKKKVKII
jgi:hypothetical protein